MIPLVQSAEFRAPPKGGPVRISTNRQSWGASRPRPRLGGAAALVWLCLLVMPGFARGETKLAAAAVTRPVTEYEVKALYLIRFLEYVVWPEPAFADPHAPVVIGVLGHNPFGKNLDEAARTSVVQDRAVIVRYGRTPEEIGSCHLLFVPATEADHNAEVAQHYAGQPVLLVADGPGGTRAGLALEFRLLGKTVRFAVNTANARSRGLELRARLLSSAIEVVSDRPPVTRVNLRRPLVAVNRR